VRALTEAEFDSIAPVYDETRRAIDAETLSGVAGMLSAHHCWSVLEVGVGTGRVSVPLSKVGVMTGGVDVSRKMLERARSKGVLDLVQADGSSTPFRERSFDAVLFAHVFHIIENSEVVLLEGARVSRVGVFALVRKREDGRDFPAFWGEGGPVVDGEERGEWFRRLAEKYNWSWDRSRHRDWGRERRLLESYPPAELVQVSNLIDTSTPEERIERFNKRAYAFTSGMPEKMKEELITEMRRRAAQMPAQGPRHIVYQVAFWRSETLLRGR
jgi:SAM-dependent methyltransferase